MRSPIRRIRASMASIGFLVAIFVLSACSKPTESPVASPAQSNSATPSTSAPAPTPPSYPSEKLLIGLPAPNAVYWDIFVAMEKGFFKEENLEAEIVLTRSSAGAIQQLAANSINLSASTPDVLIAAHSKGAENLKVLFTAANKLPWSLVVKSDISSYADLKGKTMGISALKGGETALTKRLLKQHGLNTDDVDMRIVGATPEKYAALQNGSVQAAVLFQPTDFVALQAGFKRLAYFTELDQQYPFPVYSVDTTWASQNDRGLRTARALVQAHRWLYNPANRAEAVKVLESAAKVTPEAGEFTYKLFFEELNSYTLEGEYDTKGMQTMIEIMGQDGDLQAPLPSPDRFVEQTMLEKARQSR